MKNRRLSYICCFLTVLSLVFTPFTTTLAAAALTVPEDRIEYLLVQHGTKATIDTTAGEQSFTIILHDVSPNVAYFSDRPNRKAGSMSIQDFLKLWENNNAKSFRNDPPNAYFNAMETGKGNIQNLSIVLSNPQYDSNTNTLRYTATPLPGTDMPNASSTFNYITLFIDDVCLACW